MVSTTQCVVVPPKTTWIEAIPIGHPKTYNWHWVVLLDETRLLIDIWMGEKSRLEVCLSNQFVNGIFLKNNHL